MKNKTTKKIESVVLTEFETSKIIGGNSECASCGFERGTSGRSASSDPNINKT